MRIYNVILIIYLKFATNLSKDLYRRYYLFILVIIIKDEDEYYQESNTIT